MSAGPPRSSRPGPARGRPLTSARTGRPGAGHRPGPPAATPRGVDPLAFAGWLAATSRSGPFPRGPIRRSTTGGGAGFSVIGDTSSVRFVVSPESGWSVQDGELRVAVPLAEVAALARLFDGRTGWGRFRALPGLRFRVVP